MSDKGKRYRKPESIVRKGYLKTHQTQVPERMLQEDLAALEPLTEDRVLDELQERMRLGMFHTFVGDILVILNPNEKQDIYNMEVIFRLFDWSRAFFLSFKMVSVSHQVPEQVQIGQLASHLLGRRQRIPGCLAPRGATAHFVRGREQLGKDHEHALPDRAPHVPGKGT